eukprot:11200646-Lingulodinium_polyedra.AAC.1
MRLARARRVASPWRRKPAPAAAAGGWDPLSSSVRHSPRRKLSSGPPTLKAGVGATPPASLSCACWPPS